MLILSRKETESIVLKTPSGEMITISVLAYKGNVTKIGVNAPDDIVILREELYQKTDL